MLAERDVNNTAGGQLDPKSVCVQERELGIPVYSPSGQADRKECCWIGGQRMVEKANAGL